MNSLEKNSPEVRELLAALELTSHYRGGVYWCSPRKGGVSDVQLTYPRDQRNGGDVPVVTWGHKSEIALMRLRRIEEARKQPRWGSLSERYVRITDGLRDEVIPAYRRGNFCYFTDESLDCGYIFRGFSDCVVAVCLVGQDEEKVEAKTFTEAWSELALGDTVKS